MGERERESKSQAWWGDEAVCVCGRGFMQMRGLRNKERRMEEGKEWERKKDGSE